MTIGQFLGKAMNTRNIAHLTHLALSKKQGSFAAHLALNDFYDGIVDLLDTFIESYQGKYGIETNIVIGEARLDLSYEFLENFAMMIEMETKNKLFTDTYLLNQLDEMSTLTYQTLYKLKNLV